MGTEVLYPQDVLGGGWLGSAPSTAAALYPRRRQATCRGGGGPGANPNPSPRPQRRPEPRNRREGSPRPASNSGGGNSNLVMGKVTILRRGESLDSKIGEGFKTKTRKEGRRGDQGAPAVISSDAGGDLIVFGTGRLGPEPAAVPRQTRLVDPRTGAKAGRSETYAGSAFSMSPSPRALPLPTFSSRVPVEGGSGAVDHSATRDLRRLLRLD